MSSCLSSRELLLERLQERKYCLEEIIFKYLKENEDWKQHLSKSATKIVEKLDVSRAIEQRPFFTFCVPSESILFTPKEPWEEWKPEGASVGRKVKTFQVSQLEMSSSLLVVAGDSWISFWLLPSRSEPEKLPLCDQFKWLEPHLKVLNLTFSQDKHYLLVQACSKLEYTNWLSKKPSEPCTLYNLLFSLEEYALLYSFSYSIPVAYLMQETKQWSVLLPHTEANGFYLYTIGNLGALYLVDIMEEAINFCQLSSDGVRLVAIHRIGLNNEIEEQNKRYFICGVLEDGRIEIYQATKWRYSFRVSTMKERDYVIPFRLYSICNERHVENNETNGDICDKCVALAYIFMEWDMDSCCYVLHFMVQDRNQNHVRVGSISLDFLEDKQLEKWNVCMDNTPLLWLSTIDGMVILIDIENCRHIGNILLTRKEDEDISLVDFGYFDNRAVAVWKNAPGLIHLWQNLQL